METPEHDEATTRYRGVDRRGSMSGVPHLSLTRSIVAVLAAAAALMNVRRLIVVISSPVFFDRSFERFGSVVACRLAHRCGSQARRKA